MAFLALRPTCAQYEVSLFQLASEDSLVLVLRPPRTGFRALQLLTLGALEMFCLFVREPPRVRFKNRESWSQVPPGFLRAPRVGLGGPVLNSLPENYMSQVEHHQAWSHRSLIVYLRDCVSVFVRNPRVLVSGAPDRRSHDQPNHNQEGPCELATNRSGNLRSPRIVAKRALNVGQIGSKVFATCLE